MADLNFPKDRTELVPPGTGALQTGDTYTANGTTWVYDADAGAWGSGTGAVVDTIYLSRVNDDTAQGEITFEGVTTHQGGVSVTGGDEVAVENGIYTVNNQVRFACNGLNPLRVQADTNILNVLGRNQVNTTGNSRLLFGNYLGTDFTSINDAYGIYTKLESAADVTNTCDNFYGNYVDNGTNGVGFATNSYGFYSALTTLSANGTAYNFYAAGDAPNYMAAKLSVGPHTLTPGWAAPTNNNSGVSITPGGSNFVRNESTKDLATVSMNRTGNSGGYHIRFYGAGTANGYIGRSAGNGTLYATDSGGTPAFVELADARSKTLTAFDGNAIDKIKALSPGLNGFIAHELQALVPNAVTGEENGTVSVGTYTSAEGEVETEVEEPEAIPFGATWVQTGTRDDLQYVDQTKLIPLLTKALQEAINRIDALESNEVVDDATDSALLTLVANLATRVSALEGA